MRKVDGALCHRIDFSSRFWIRSRRLDISCTSRLLCMILNNSMIFLEHSHFCFPSLSDLGRTIVRNPLRPTSLYKIFPLQPTPIDFFVWRKCSPGLFEIFHLSFNYSPPLVLAKLHLWFFSKHVIRHRWNKSISIAGKLQNKCNEHLLI